MGSNTETRKPGPEPTLEGDVWDRNRPDVLVSAGALLDRERLSARVETLRMEVLRLRSSRRTLLTMLEMETGRRSVLEREVMVLRSRLARARIGKGRS